MDENVLLIDLLYLFFGLLFVSVNAPMALADERTRGSLDVLLSTPLSTPSIVWAKWWGIFRSVPPLLVIPGVVQLLMASPDRRWAGFFASSGLLLASGALITSFGLAASLGTPRLGRAIGLSVGGYVVLTLGSYFIGCIGSMYFDRSGQQYGLGILEASPCFGVGIIASESANRAVPNAVVPNFEENWRLLVGFAIGWITVYTSMAAALYAGVLLLFDHCLGRVRGRPVRGDGIVFSRMIRKRTDPLQSVEWAG